MSAQILFVIGLACGSFVVCIAVYSVLYYFKAKRIAPLLRKKDELLRDISEAQKKKSELEKAIGGKQAELSQAERIIQIGEAERKFLAGKAGEIAAAKRDIAELHAGIAKLTKEHQGLTNKIGEQQQALATLRQEEGDLQRQKSELDVRIAAKREQETQLSAQIEANNRTIGAQKTELDALAEKKSELDAEVKNLLEQKKEKESLERKIEALKEKLEELEKKRVSIVATLNTLQGDLIGIEARSAQNVRRWEDLDRKIEVVEESKEPRAVVGGNATDTERQWLLEFKKSLSRNHIIFNQRTICAFHTALKCAACSPIVVLSGISGTGKSLLPELYAAALGINFLPIAVQPRWDSPNDIFGFYNYMERKFKATELSRLLWQCDNYNRISEAEFSADDGNATGSDEEKKRRAFLKAMQAVNASKEQRSRGMNLVLLDEMNLARVEYYFSDLLSKLETRYGIDPEIDGERRKAEIELDCGSSATRRLFVNKNTLFVGTMNEDESTQMLSDKVVDRANVLRFGRPQNAQQGTGGAGGNAAVAQLLSANKAEFIQGYAKCPRVDFDTWNHWLNNGNDIGPVRENLNRINDALNSVGRPFGWRTQKAVETYIAAYPRLDGDGNATFKHAWADQIEMKILPKLNGLDLGAPNFNEVRNVLSHEIRNVGDNALLNAFNDACNGAVHTFFKWRGVMR